MSNRKLTKEEIDRIKKLKNDAGDKIEKAAMPVKDPPKSIKKMDTVQKPEPKKTDKKD